MLCSMTGVPCWLVLNGVCRVGRVACSLRSLSLPRSIIKGRGRCKALLADVHDLWLRLALGRTESWFDYVRSRSNISDFPSRFSLPWGATLLGVRVQQVVVPPCAYPWN